MTTANVFRLCAVLLFLCIVQSAWGDVTRDQLDRLLDSSIHGWRWRLGDAPGAERSEGPDVKLSAGYMLIPAVLLCILNFSQRD